MKTIYELKEIKWDIPFLKKVKRYKLVIVLCLISFSFTLKGQKLSPKIWHEGYVVTNDRDTVRGSLKYDFESNLIQVIVADQRTITFSSQQLLMLRFYDTYFNRNRAFYAIPYRLAGNVKNPIFFEVLVEGPMTLMTREYLVLQSVNNYNSPFYRSTASSQIGSYEILSYDYYFLNVEGDIIPFTEKKKDLLRIFDKHQDEMHKYIKKNKLHVDKQADLVSATVYFNKLERN